MPHKFFKRKSNGTSMHNSDVAANESKAVYSSNIKSERDAANNGIIVPNRIFIGGLSSNTDEWDIRTKFCRHGHVKFVKIIKDNMGSSKGYGFVTFATEEDAKNIIGKVQITIKGRKLNIAQAIRKQINQSDTSSTEMSSVGSLLEVSSTGSYQEMTGYQSKTNFSKHVDYSRSAFNWNIPHLLETSGYLGATTLLNASENPSGNPQVNCFLSYPALVYIPYYPCQQTTGFTYAAGGSFPDLVPLVTVPMSPRSINTELK